MLESLPLHRTTMILWGELTHVMLYCIHILTKEEWGNTGRTCVSTFFSRIVLNSYIIFREIMPAGSKPISRLDYIIKLLRH
jgi:hypothetical protein